MASSSEEEEIGEQIRVSFVLDASVSDRSLEVPSEPIAIPADLKRKGLSAVINHLLDRNVEENDNNQDKQEALPFDFIVANRLLRTGVETAARRHGLSLEQAIRISYFPAQQAPEESNQGEPEPDWISCIAHAPQRIYTGGYDGSIVFHDEKLQTIASVRAHSGPIKCLSTMTSNGLTMIATGSLDQTLVTHCYDISSNILEKRVNFVGGHTSSIGSVDMLESQQQMVSGDWDGGLALWNLSSAQDSNEAMEEPVKKRKTSSTAKSTVQNIQPLTKFQAHSSQISGVSWSKHDSKTLITASWDHTLKVWNMERQESLLTLNGSRVISCMDASMHSQVVATGHPDCTIRLWDVRTNSNDASTSSSLVSDCSLKPSHKAWVSAVKWSLTDPFALASTSYDGTIKVWDIRSTLPLHTVRAFPKEEKGLCLAFGDKVIYAGGGDCVVKEFKC